MIIDCHNHADWHRHNLTKFVENMDRYHIDKTWLLTWESPEDEYSPSYNQNVNVDAAREGGPISFARTLSYVERCPERFVLGFAPDPRRPNSIDRLKAAVSIYGAKVCGEVKLRMMYDNPDAIRMWRVAGELGLPVTFHFDYEFDAPDGRMYPRPNYWYGGDQSHRQTPVPRKSLSCCEYTHPPACNSCGMRCTARRTFQNRTCPPHSIPQ